MNASFLLFSSSVLTYCLSENYPVNIQAAAECVASLQKGPHVAKIKIEIFVDLNRAGHDKSVEKKLAF